MSTHNENGEAIIYRNFPTNYDGMLPLSDAEARRMGCTIYRGIWIPFDRSLTPEKRVTYQYEGSQKRGK